MFSFSEEGVTKMDSQQTTVKTDMQSDENSGEEGDASANLGGDQKAIGFLTEWVSAYNFIKGMVLIKYFENNLHPCMEVCLFYQTLLASTSVHRIRKPFTWLA